MPKTIRVAAAGDIHAGSAERDRVIEAFRRVEGQADLILLAGAPTHHGPVGEACVVAAACRDPRVPAVAVLRTHSSSCTGMPTTDRSRATSTASRSTTSQCT